MPALTFLIFLRYVNVIICFESKHIVISFEFCLDVVFPVLCALLLELAHEAQLVTIVFIAGPSILQIKYRERAIGLILVSPICRKPTWSEWIYNKVGTLKYSSVEV